LGYEPYLLGKMTKQIIAYCEQSSGPVFGGNNAWAFDIALRGDSNNNHNSLTNFPNSYIDSIGKGQATFTGSLHFNTDDVEIYNI